MKPYTARLRSNLTFRQQFAELCEGVPCEFAEFFVRPRCNPGHRRFAQEAKELHPIGIVRKDLLPCIAAGRPGKWQTLVKAQDARKARQPHRRQRLINLIPYVQSSHR